MQANKKTSLDGALAACSIAYLVVGLSLGIWMSVYVAKGVILFNNLEESTCVILAKQLEEGIGKDKYRASLLVSYLVSENGEIDNITSNALRVQSAAFRSKQTELDWMNQFVLYQQYDCFYENKETVNVFMEKQLPTSYMIGLGVAGGSILLGVIVMFIARR